MNPKTFREAFGKDIACNAESFFADIILDVLRRDGLSNPTLISTQPGPDFMARVNDRTDLLVEIKVATLSGRIPSSSYVGLLGQLRSWINESQIRYGAKKVIGLLITNYSFNSDMMERLKEYGVSVFTFDLDGDRVEGRMRLETQLERLLHRPLL